MNKSKTISLLKYGITTGICLILSAAYFFSKIPLSAVGAAAAVDLLAALCDAFFLPGLFVLMLGLLLWIASEGGLDGIGYLMSYAVKTLIPGKHSTVERYSDYRSRMQASRKTGYGFLMIVGIVFLAIAAACLAFYFSLA